MGHAIIWLHGHNVAWCYADYADAFWNGCARLGHAPAWLVLGAVCGSGSVRTEGLMGDGGVRVPLVWPVARHHHHLAVYSWE